MYWKRKLLIGALAFGTIAGYGSGLASFGWHARACHEQRREAFEAHVADVCTRSAERVYRERGEGERGGAYAYDEGLGRAHGAHRGGHHGHHPGPEGAALDPASGVSE